MKNKNSRTYIHVLFDEICKLEDRNERIKYLKENANIEIRSVLKLCYNDKIILDLPKGRPPFTECGEGREPSPLSKALAPIASLLPNHPSNLSQIRKEKLFIGMLESICAEDAAILCAAKDGTITNLQNKKYRKNTKSLVEAAFPELLK